VLISVNGVEKKVESELIVAQLVSELKLKGRFAIEINGEIVPKSSYLKKILKENDRIEIVSAVGGG